MLTPMPIVSLKVMSIFLREQLNFQRENLITPSYNVINKEVVEVIFSIRYKGPVISIKTKGLYENFFTYLTLFKL